jgi:hypothetical protein
MHEDHGYRRRRPWLQVVEPAHQSKRVFIAAMIAVMNASRAYGMRRKPYSQHVSPQIRRFPYDLLI